MRRRDVLAAAAGLFGAATAAGTAATPADYEPLGFAPVDRAKEVVVAGEYAYTAATDGFAVVDISDPTAPAVVAQRRDVLSDREGGPLGDIWDVAVGGDRLLVVGPAHGDAALSGAAVYDVTDPTAPTLAGFHRTDYPVHNADLAGGVAYLTGNDGDRNPLVTVDAATQEELGRWSLLDYDSRWAEVDPGLRTLHDVSVSGDRAYLAHWDAGTRVLDVTDPAAPAHTAATFQQGRAELVDAPHGERSQLPGNDHFAAVDDAGTLLGVGREAWDVDPEDDRDGGPGGIDLYDLSGSAPLWVATVDPPPTPDPTYGGTWTTAHNFDLAGDRLYSAWYRGGVRIHDVSDPTDPRELAWWRHPGTTSFWTAQRGDGAVVASSRRDREGVFTFPDRAGRQPDPPRLTTTTADSRTPTSTAATTQTATPTETATATPTATDTAPPTETATATPTATATDTGDTATAGTDRPATTTGGSAPGFGVGAGLAAAALAAWRRYG